MRKSVYTANSTRFIYEHLDLIDATWALLDEQGMTVDITREVITAGIQACLTAWVSERVAYSDVRHVDYIDEWCDAVGVAIPRDGDVHDEVTLHLEEYFNECLDEVVPKDTWLITTVHFDITGIMIVEIGPDYRIHDWMKTHRPNYVGVY